MILFDSKVGQEYVGLAVVTFLIVAFHLAMADEMNAGVGCHWCRFSCCYRIIGDKVYQYVP
jgi:hypothetical protein